MQHQQEYTLFKIILLGDKHVGKSTLLQNLMNEVYADDYCETLGVDLREKFLILSKKLVKLRIWDASGSPRLNHLVLPYLSQTNGALICFDLTDLRSLYVAKSYIEQFREHQKEAPVILVGCKSDKLKEREIGIEQAQKLAIQLESVYVETSSHLQINIEEPFHQIGHRMLFFKEIADAPHSKEEYSRIKTR